MALGNGQPENCPDQASGIFAKDGIFGEKTRLICVNAVLTLQ